jgi:CubicO group peptidase (beta-lactamase class C family)
MSFIARARPNARTVEELLAGGVASSERRGIVTPEELQTRVQDAVDERIDSGTELGAQVAVFHGGRLVVNVASGLADMSGRVVQPDTLFWAASTAKGVASTVAHVLAELGVLDYDMPLAAVWPEFAQYGKDTVTVRHVLCHTAGVPGLPVDLTPAELCDWERMCTLLAEAQLWWEPGTAFGYHAHTFGFLLGETLRRLTGRSISTLLRELITAPLGVADEIHFGVPDRLLPSVAQQVAYPGSVPNPPEPGSAQARALPAAVAPTADLANRPDILRADIPSTGTMTAAGAARMYAALLGHVDETALVAPDRLRTIADVVYTGADMVMGVPTQWAFGYSPYRPAAAAARAGSTLGMVGANGSAAFADIESGVAVAIMRNRFSVGDFDLATRVDTLVAQSIGGLHRD